MPPSGLGARMWRVVEGVVDAGEPVGPRGLARSLGIDRSAVGRILQQLVDLGVLRRTPEGYVPGPRLLTLGRVMSAQDTLPNVVGSILGELVDLFDETCYICAFHGDVGVFTHEIQSSKPLRLVVELGKPVPLYAGAAGRAILSGLPSESVAGLLGADPLPRLAAGTITAKEELTALAQSDRERGYVVSFEERVPGGAAVAAPFFGPTGWCQGSVVFTSPTTRVDRAAMGEIGEAVRAAASRLSTALGFVGASADA